MSYRYKQDFGKCFYDLPLPQNEGTINHPLIELDEVYRKAEVFDAILKAYDEAFAIEHMAREVSNIIEKYESGDYDE